MKKGIHPQYDTVKVIKTNGETFEVKSCLAAKVKEYHLEVSAEEHPAWSKKNRFTGASIGNMRKFEKQYPGLENLK